MVLGDIDGFGKIYASISIKESGLLLREEEGRPNLCYAIIWGFISPYRNIAALILTSRLGSFGANLL